MKKITEKNTKTASVAVQTQLTFTNMNNIFDWDTADGYDDLNITEHSDTIDDDNDLSEHEHELSNDDLGLLYEETLILVDEFLLSNPICIDIIDTIGNATIETKLYDHVFPFIYYSVILELSEDEDDEDDEDDDDDDDDDEDDDDEDDDDEVPDLDILTNEKLYNMLNTFFVDEYGVTIATSMSNISYELHNLNKNLSKLLKSKK